MLRVRMKTHITGYRNDAEWPPVGGEIDLPDQEAADLEAAGYGDIIGEAQPAPPAPGEDVALDAMTAKALRTFAEAAAIEIPRRMKRKDDLVAHITAELAAAAAEEDPEEDPDEGSTSDPRTGQPAAPGPDGAAAGAGAGAAPPADPGPGDGPAAA